MRMNEAMRFYIKRKLGRSQSFSYIVSAYLPSLLIFIIFLLIVSITIIVYSMGIQTDRTIQLLGSGAILSFDEVDETFAYYDEIEVFPFKETQSLSYGKEETLMLYMKGVEDSYFTEARKSVLNFNGNLEIDRSIVLSRFQLDKLNLSIGDSIVIVLYDSKLNRVRPVYCQITGSYSSGYGEFDQNLAYVPISLLQEDVMYEILLKDDGTFDKIFKRLEADGYNSVDYKTLYSDLLSNITLSLSLINFIVIIISASAGFFAINIVAEYLSRDRNAIKSLYFMGFSNIDIKKTYKYLCFSVSLISSIFGGFSGLILSSFLTKFIKALDPVKYPVLINYVTNIELRIPYSTIFLIYLMMMLVSYVTIHLGIKGQRWDK